MSDETDIPPTRRDLQREAINARENKAVMKVFRDFMRSRQDAAIDGATVEEREQARMEYLAARLLLAELEALATAPDDPP